MSPQPDQLGDSIGYQILSERNLDIKTVVWALLVSTGSKQLLGHDGDKIVAITEIAVTYNQLINDEYIAGIWNPNIIDGLVWTIERFRLTIWHLTNYGSPSRS